MKNEQVTIVATGAVIGLVAAMLVFSAIRPTWGCVLPVFA